MEQVVIQRFSKARTTSAKQRAVCIQEKNLTIVYHVDSLVIFGRTTADIEAFHDQGRHVFKIKDLGKPAQFPEIEFAWIPDRAAGIRQSTLIENFLRGTGMKDGKPIGSPMNQDVSDEEVSKGGPLSTDERAHYRSIVGSPLYIATKSRPDIAFAASKLGSYVSS